MADIARSLTVSPHVMTPGHLAQNMEEDHTDPTNREYNFFITTNSQHQPDGMDRGLIRRLVMRNFFDTRCANAQVEMCASAHNSANTVLAKKQLKNRFRLTDIGAEPKKSRKGSRSKSKEISTDKNGKEKESAVTAKKKRPKTTRTTSASTTASTNTSISSTSVFPTWQISTMVCTQQQHAAVYQNPSTQTLDPFDVLPIPNSPHLTFLFKLYKSTTPLNSLATNPSSTWWSFISCSAALLHATLATWALYGLLVCKGGEGLKLVEWGLKHKSEAIRGVNRGIREGNSMGGGRGEMGRRGVEAGIGRVSEEVIGCVVVVASFENLQGTYPTAHLHLIALRRMVLSHGGLEALQHNEGLVRGIVWVEFHTATAHHTPPSFPFIPPTSSTPFLPDPFLELAALTSPTSLLHLSLSEIPCFNIFYRLHRLGLALSRAWFGKLDRSSLSDMLYETEWMILNVQDYSRVYIDFDLEGVGSGEEWESRRREADAAAVVEGTLAAAQIFVYASLRGLPRNARIFGILGERVRRAVDRPTSKSLWEVWNEQGNANVLLWVLVMACSVTGDRGWYVERLGEVLNVMGLETKVEMEMVLRNVAWVDGYLDRVMIDIWGEVSGLRRRASILMDLVSSPVRADLRLDELWDIERSEQDMATAAGNSTRAH